jgi:hypothetical protein
MGPSRCTYLVEYGCHNLVKNHVLISGGRENLVELVGLVAERVRAHGKIYGASLDSIRRDNDAGIFFEFAVVASPTPDDDIDICFLIGSLEVALLALEIRRRRRPHSPRGSNGLCPRLPSVVCRCRGAPAGEMGGGTHDWWAHRAGCALCRHLRSSREPRHVWR